LVRTLGWRTLRTHVRSKEATVRARVRVDDQVLVVDVTDARTVDDVRRRLHGAVLRGDIGTLSGPAGPTTVNWRAVRTVEVLGAVGTEDPLSD